MERPAVEGSTRGGPDRWRRLLRTAAQSAAGAAGHDRPPDEASQSPRVEALRPPSQPAAVRGEGGKRQERDHERLRRRLLAELVVDPRQPSGGPRRQHQHDRRHAERAGRDHPEDAGADEACDHSRENDRNSERDEQAGRARPGGRAGGIGRCGVERIRDDGARQRQDEHRDRAQDAAALGERANQQVDREHDAAHAMEHRADGPGMPLFFDVMAEANTANAVESVRDSRSLPASSAIVSCPTCDSVNASMTCSGARRSALFRLSPRSAASARCRGAGQRHPSRRGRSSWRGRAAPRAGCRAGGAREPACVTARDRCFH